MKQILNNNSGMALLVTLAVISILLTLALRLARITGESVMATQKDKTEFIAQEMAVSGIHLAMAILAEDAVKNEIDSLQEDWANPEKISRAIEMLGYPKEKEQPRLSLTITDELGKLQVNALLKKFPGHELNNDQTILWENLLNLWISADKSDDSRDPAAIINAIKDWLDSGDDEAITGLSGAESDYYLGLDSPYIAGNGPFNQISELSNVKGISPLIKPGLLESTFTVYGLDAAPPAPSSYGFSGKININTAKVDILAALLPQGMEERAEDLVAFRQEKTDKDDVFVNFLDKGWYERVIKLPEKEKKRFDRMIRYNSNMFKAKCTAQVDKVPVMVSAIIKREQNKETNLWQCRIIQLTKE